MDFNPKRVLKIILSRVTVPGLRTPENASSKADGSELHKSLSKEENKPDSLEVACNNPLFDPNNGGDSNSSKPNIVPKDLSSIESSCVGESSKTRTVTLDNTSVSIGSCDETRSKSANLFDLYSIQASLAVTKKKKSSKNVCPRKDLVVSSKTDISHFSKVSFKPKESLVEDFEGSTSKSASCSSSKITVRQGSTKADPVKDSGHSAKKLFTSKNKTCNSKLKTSKVTFDSLKTSHSDKLNENSLIKTPSNGSKNEKSVDDVSLNPAGNKSKLFSNPNWLLGEEKEKSSVKSTSVVQRKKKPSSASSNKSLSISNIIKQVQKKTDKGLSSKVPSETSSSVDQSPVAETVSSDGSQKINRKVLEISPKKISDEENSLKSKVLSETSTDHTSAKQCSNISTLADTSFAVQNSDVTTECGNKPSPKPKLSVADYLRRSSVKSTDSDVCVDSDCSTDTCSACSMNSQSYHINDSFSGSSLKKSCNFHESCFNITQNHYCVNNEILTDTSFEKVMSDASSKLSSVFSSKFLSKNLTHEKLDLSTCGPTCSNLSLSEGSINNNNIYKGDCLGSDIKTSLNDNFEISSKRVGDVSSKPKAETSTSSFDNDLSISHKKTSPGKNLTVLNKHLTVEVASKRKANTSDNHFSSRNNLTVTSKHVADFLPKMSVKMSGDKFSSGDNSTVSYKCPADKVSANMKITSKISPKKPEKRKISEKCPMTNHLKRSKVEEQKRRWMLHKIELKVPNEEIISKKLCRLRYRIFNGESFVNKLTLKLKTLPDFAEITDFTLPQFRYGLPDCERSLNVIYTKVKERNDIISSMKQLSMLKNHFPELLGLSLLEHKKCQSSLNGTFINIKGESPGKADCSKSLHQTKKNSSNLRLPQKVTPDEKLKKIVFEEKERLKLSDAAPSTEAVSKTCDNKLKSVIPERLILGASICEGDENVNDKENKIKFNDHSPKRSGLSKVSPLSKTSEKNNRSNNFSLKVNNMNSLLDKAVSLCQSALKRNLEFQGNESGNKKFKDDLCSKKDSDDSGNNKAKEMPSSKPNLFEKWLKFSSEENITSQKRIPEITLDESSLEDSNDCVLFIAASDILPEDSSAIDMNVDSNIMTMDLNSGIENMDVDCKIVDMDIPQSPTNSDDRNSPSCIDGLDSAEYNKRKCNSGKHFTEEPISMTEVQLEIKNLCKPADHKIRRKPESTDSRPFSSRCESNLVQIETVTEHNQKQGNDSCISNSLLKVPFTCSRSPDFQVYQSILPQYDNFNQYQSFLPSSNTGQAKETVHSSHPSPKESPHTKSPDFQMYQPFFSGNTTFSEYQSYLPNNHLNNSILTESYSSFDIEPVGKSHSGGNSNNISTHQNLSNDCLFVSNKSDCPAFQNVNSPVPPSNFRVEVPHLSNLKSMNDQVTSTDGLKDPLTFNSVLPCGYIPNVFGQPSSHLPRAIDPQVNQEPGFNMQFVDPEPQVQSNLPSHNVQENGNVLSQGQDAILLPSKTSFNIIPSPPKEISISKILPLGNTISTNENILPANEVSLNQTSLSAYNDDIIQINKDNIKEPEIKNDVAGCGIPPATTFGGVDLASTEENDKISLELQKWMQATPVQSAEEASSTTTDHRSLEDDGIKEAEKRDHLNPEWDYWKRLTNDKDRYKNVRMAWKNLRIPNPKVNLTIRNSQRRNGFAPAASELQESFVNQEVPTISCDLVFVDQVAENMHKLQQNLNSLHDKLQYELHVQSMNHENTLRNCPNPALIPDLERQHFKTMHKTQDYFDRVMNETRAELMGKNECLRRVCQEVVSFHKFYDDLDGEKPEYSTRLTSEEFEEIKEINQMLESYSTFYK